MSVRVLVVDDSAFMRKIISNVLNEDDQISVVETAKNGEDAIIKAKQCLPDVITLDVEMPIMNGLDCLKHLMNKNPIPVIMLSNFTNEGADATIKALELGAIDFIAKPENIFDIGAEKLRREIIEKVKIAGRTKLKFFGQKAVSSRQGSSLLHGHYKSNDSLGNNDPGNSKQIDKLIAVGASTGGPRALQQVISALPGNLPAALLIVQHMPAEFTKSLANRLNAMSQLTVKEANDGDIVTAGCAYIAPGGFHMIFEQDVEKNQLIIRLNKGQPVNGHRPSVDTMMNSLSDTGLQNIIGVIMTGMGMDGCKGLEKLKKYNKAAIIAQNEESCVVYGMPKAAVVAGIVDKIVSLQDISDEILKLMGV